MNLKNYLRRLEKNHKKRIQSGFEKNDRNTFIEEILGQLGYSYDNVYYDVPQKVKGRKGKTPDIRIYGDSEKKTKNMMSRFIIETKNYGSLNGNIDNIDYLQLKNYVIINSGKIKYIASTDYISFFLFNAEVLLNEHKLNMDAPSKISKSEIAGFESVLVRKFDFTKFSKQDEQKIEMLSHKNLFEIYDFPHPERNADRFNIQNKTVRGNFIRSLYYLMEEVKGDISTKFSERLGEFKKEYQELNRDNFKDSFLELVNKKRYRWIRNLFFWAIEMNYTPNFFEKSSLFNKDDIDIILNKKNPKSKDFYYAEYLITAIYSIINKTLFIRILEDSSYSGGYRFIKGEKDGRYLSNGIVHEMFIRGNLKEYISSLFEFKKKDLEQYHFLLKHDIYDWIITEIEEYTLVDFLRTFNEIFLRELDQDILGDIYEHYLQEDRDECKGKSYRRMLGQYYTPRPIVRLMWLLVRDVLKRNKNIDLYTKGQELLDILDPFMGSGTFLNEAVLQMKMSDSGKPIRKGEVFHFFRDRNENKLLENSLNGFEINPLSCSIADINIYFRLIKSFSSTKIEKNSIEELKLLRTDSFDLDYKPGELKDNIQLPLYAEEIKTTFSERTKIIEAKMKKYDVILSNPPYGTIRPTKFMKEELIPFAFPKNNFDKNGNLVPFNWKYKNRKGKIPKLEKNRGKLRDMYAFALGVADRLIKDEGIICFITSNTYLTLPTYKWMRKYWLENYSIEYIINFNRIMEKANSMFSPESAIATTIIVMTKKKPDKNHKIKYLDLSNLNSIKEKYDYFNDIEWKEPVRDKNDIKVFRTKMPTKLSFEEIPISAFLENRDYQFIQIDDVIRKIERDTNFLLNFGIWTNGIITKDDNTFFNYSKVRLEQIIKDRFGEKEFDSEKIKKSINPKQIIKYGLDSEPGYIYYDTKKLWRARDEKEMERKHKLILSCHYFYVDSEYIYPLFNAVENKNCYFLGNDDENILYFICGILNSRLGQYYRHKTQIDNYERFPIKKIERNEDLFKRIVTEVKTIHKLKSDYQKFKKGRVDFESHYFLNNISDKLEIYLIEEPNEYFDLKFPKGIGANFLIEIPRISSSNEKVIELNEGGLNVICKTKDIAKMIFEKYFKNAYGNINEMDIHINITQMDTSKFKQIEQDIIREVESIERKIDILVYALYFNVNVEFKDGIIENESEIFSDENIKKVEEYLNEIKE